MEQSEENEFVQKQQIEENQVENIAKNSSNATEYQISTIVGLVKKLAGSLPYAEQIHKLLKTIVAVCGIEIVKENEE